MNSKNKFNLVFVLAIIIFTVISSTPANAANLKVYHKGNAYSSYFDSGHHAVNGWSTVVMTTASLMDTDKRNGRTTIQAWGRLDTLEAMYSPAYYVGIMAIETKMKTTTAASDQAFDILGTNPGHKLSSYAVPTFPFDLVDYVIPGTGLIGTLIDNYSNGLTSGTSRDLSNSKNATLTFLDPVKASLSNNISWTNANKVIGSKKKSGVTAEFNFRILNGVKINVAPQARVQYGLLAPTAIVPIKVWTNYAYVNHTIN